MQQASTIVNNKVEFLRFLHGKFTMIHLSNFFFRDLHYGVMAYLHSIGAKATYPAAEQIARSVGEELERQGIFKRLDHQSWLVVYPEFALPRIEKKVS
jgi:hypothetical protein